jgi:mono/diheme cytochrome c family protein
MAMTKTTKKRMTAWGRPAGFAAAVALAAAGAVACSSARATETAKVDGSAPVERGRYLVGVMGCNDCHTPLKMGANGPEPDMARLLSGHPEQVGIMPPARLDAAWAWAGAGTNTAFAGPWGVSYAANLTPDQNTGLGIWTEEMFVNAIRTGRHMGTSRPIMPPMPWTSFRTATDADLKAVFAYLRTIPAISNHVPDGEPALPAAARSDD